jgi:DNA-directed RNA polymerase subunit RPC12/RpoP
MDLIFKCPHCDQEMEVDASGSGTEIECPSCNRTIIIPEATPQNLLTLNPIASSAAARESKHFKVPVRAAPSEVLIEKSKPTLDVAAKETEKQLRVKTIRHSDCAEVGKDRFDAIVTELLQKIGAENIVSINPINYSHVEISSQKIVTDFGVMIVFRG